ncbi:MEIOTIC F-BOX protein MOF-like isoform X1 [Lolium rigidum]|uniref:MEIOTIC F-BOX protein MOF-like isoform X1 n=1 Tax=Lolium rigidum TaxID=89674 RepID=UPI001F5CEE6D|nr:MEIOTIC F-BOX protein MOF-like isoform X1 [Lolium rigidum]
MEAVTDRRLHAGGSTDDRLSALPDDLLHRILSFLPCQRTVQTTVLSKRWAGLWRSAPCININMVYFSTRSRHRWQKIEDLVTNFLIFHNAPVLDAFRIAMDGVIADDWLPAINRWVRRGILGCPSVLEIEFFDTGIPNPPFGDTIRPGPFELPDIGSTSSSRLKKLSLVGVSLGSSFAELLRSGCPVLEDLHLEDCCTEFNHIQSHTLKKLTIHICYRHSVGTLAIKAPALVELVLDPDISMPEYTQKNEFSLADGSTNSLVDAWVVFPNDMSPRSRVMLLGSLSNVTKLELTACFSAELMLDNELGQFPIFSNMRALWLRGCVFGNRDGKCSTLDIFLQKTPNLKKLTLEHQRPCCCKNTFQEAGRKKRKDKTSSRSLHCPDQKAFQCPNLKLIEIIYEARYTDDHHELQMFQVMRGLWRNLQQATFTVTKI